MLSRALLFVRGDFLRDGAIVFASGLVVNLCNYVFHFYMTRHVPPASYGALSSLLAVSSVLAIPAAMLTLVVVKYSAELYAVGDTGKLHTLCRRVAVICTAVSAVVLAAFLLESSRIAAFLHVDDAAAVAIAGGVIAAGLINPALRGVLQGAQDFRGLGIAMGIEGIGKCLLGIAFAAAGFGIRGALAGYVAGCILSLVYALAVIARFRSAAAAPLRIDLKRLAVSMGGIFIAMGALQIATFFDVILVKHYFSPEQAGVYSAVALSGKVVLFLVGFIPGIVLPKAAALDRRGERATPVLIQALVLTAGMSIAVLAIVFLMPHVVMRIFSGSQYLAGTSLLPLYASAMTLLAGASTVANYQIGLHRFHFVVPLALAFALEAAAIALYHDSLRSIVYALLAGNAALLLSTLYVPARVRKAARLRPVQTPLAG